MEAALRKEYANVSRDTVSAFLKLCDQCVLKRSQPKKGLVVRPIVSNSLCSRAQADLIDYQSNPDGNYKYILNYQDHLTKFCFLKPLEITTAAEVAWKIYEIFGTVGGLRLGMFLAPRATKKLPKSAPLFY